MTVKTRKITIKTVAADAGVSVSAVSKVLRNAYGVSESLRENVQESINRLGYRPSSAARAMRGQSFTIGVLLVGLDNPFLNKVIAGASAVLDEAGFKTMMAVGQAETHIESKLIETMLDFKMDGLMLIAPRMAAETLESVSRQIPIAVVAHHEPDARYFDTINSDDHFGGMRAAEALWDAGYHDAGMFTLPERLDRPADVALQRELGFIEAMQARGVANPRIYRMSEGEDDDGHHLDEMLLAPDRPRALFCWSDLHAVRVVNHAAQLGIRVPGDLALIGYDNSPVAALPLVDVSSFRQNALELGATSANCLLTRISGRSHPEHHLLPPELVRRGSM